MSTISKKTTIAGILEFASRTNNIAASYLLRAEGLDNFDGTYEEYMNLMKFLTTNKSVNISPIKIKRKQRNKKCK